MIEWASQFYKKWKLPSSLMLNNSLVILFTLSSRPMILFRPCHCYLFIPSYLFCFSIQIVNPHLLKDLTERGLWNEEMKNQIIACNGSIQVQNEKKKGRGELTEYWYFLTYPRQWRKRMTIHCGHIGLYRSVHFCSFAHS